MVAVAVASKHPSPALRLLDSVPVKWWLVLAAALILGASALFGGLDDATVAAPEPVLVGVGEPFVGPQLTTTILSTELTDVAPGYSLEPGDGNTYLVVTATVTNTWTTSTELIRDLLQLEWLDGEGTGEADRLTLVSDGTSSPQANPGVPIEVAYVWEVPEGVLAPGDVARVSIRSKSLTVDGDVSYGSYWSSPVVAAHADVEVVG